MVELRIADIRCTDTFVQSGLAARTRGGQHERPARETTPFYALRALLQCVVA